MNKIYIKTDDGVDCCISYSNQEEYLAVVNNPDLLRCSTIWHECIVDCYKENHLYYTDFGAIKRGAYTTSTNHYLPAKIVVQGVYSGYPQINFGGKNKRTHTILMDELEGRKIDYLKEKVSTDHINSQSWDNRTENLRLINAKEQMNNEHTKNKVHDSHVGTTHIKPFYRIVGENIDSGEVVVFNNIKEACNYCGIKYSSNISDVLNKAHISAGGWKFFYWEDYYSAEDLLTGEYFISLDPHDDYKEEFPTITSNVQVSNLGRIRFWEKTHWCYTVGHIKKGTGRYEIMIGKKSYKLARIVCLFFHHDTYKKGLVVRHLDGNKTNNTPENLAWGTARENQLDERYNKKRTKPIIMLDSNDNFVRRFESLSEAERLCGYKTQSVSVVCQGKQKKYKNMKFMYAENYSLA